MNCGKITEQFYPALLEMLSQAEDIRFGTESETNLHKQIESLVGDEVIWKGGFDTFDFHNKAKTIWVELKTRRIKHDTYPTALIGKNKVEFCNSPGVDYYFVFSYLDGLFYIKYDKALFDTFKDNNNFYRSVRDDCNTARQTVIYIPIEHLKKSE